MKDFLLKLIGLVVPDPSAVNITETQTHDLYTYDLTVPADEIGRVIGKNGNIIRSIRTLMRLKANSQAVQVIVRLNEPTIQT